MTPQPVRAFRSLCRRYFDAVAEHYPETASEWGLPGFDHELGRNDAATHASFARVQTALLAACEALPSHAFTGDDWLDRRGFLSLLRTGLWEHHARRPWERNPQVHVDAAFQAILMPVIRGSDRLAAISPAIASRLKRIPGFLAAGLESVRAPVPLWRELATRACAGAPEFFAALAPRFPEIPGALFDGAAKAFGEFAEGLERRKPGPRNGYAAGREGFEMLIRERLGLDWSAAEAVAMGESLVAQLEAELRAECRRHGRRHARDLIEEAAAAWTPGGALLDEYRAVTLGMRDRFRTAGLVTMPPGEKLEVLAVPAFLRHQFPTAAYHQPPPFAKAQTGVFWVNDLAAEARDERTRRAETRQHFGLELTCAHEAYPGHHLQFFVQNRHPSRIRRIMAHAVFYEGWTLWCERMCVEHGIYDAPHARVVQLHDALWRAHRIVIDCGIHAAGMSLSAARKRLVDGVGFTPARARGDLNWYTAAPTVPMSYLLGRLELERVLAAKRAAGWDVRRFNDWALSHGAVPWTWIERAAASRP